MRRATLVGFAGAVAVAFATGSADAAPPWSEPQDLTGRFVRLSEPSIAFGGDGSALLSWTEHTPTLSAGDVLRTRFASRQTDGSIVDRGTVPDALPVPPAVYGRNRTVVLRERAAKGGTGVRIDAAFGTIARPLGSRFRRVATFGTLEDWEGPALAVSEKGEAAVMWTEFRPGAKQGRHRVRVAFGRPGRGFGRPRTLAVFGELERDSQSGALAYGRRGDLVLAYAIGPRTARSGAAVAARLRAPGKAIGRPQVLGRRFNHSGIVAGVSARGRAVVMWATQAGGEDPRPPWILRAAIRSPNRRFGRAVGIDSSGVPDSAPGGMALAVAADGSATAAWGNVRGAAEQPQYPVLTATASSSGGFGPITQLADTGLVGSVAARADGTTLVTWADQAPVFLFPNPDPQPGVVVAAVRPPGGSALGPPETVSSPGLYDIPPPAAAFDPLTGRPTAIWPKSNRDGDGRIQIATRAG